MYSKFKSNCKNLLLKINFFQLFPFLIRPSLLISNTIKLSCWIKEYVSDLNKPAVKFIHRNDHYEYVYKSEINQLEIDYLEFGVFKGDSIKWWLSKNKNPLSRFNGFDTFEGLPEKWGTYAKGDFYSNLPEISDDRLTFIKGLFQETLPKFLGTIKLKNKLLIHMDADLFSSTLFALTSLAPFLKPGDIILFDEFSVPNDEFAAFEIFCRSYYIKYELISATMNFIQIAIKIL